MNATAHFVLFGRPDKSGRERRLAGAAVCCCLLLMHSPRPYWAVGDAEEKRLMNQASAVFHTKENGRPGLLHEQMGKRRTTADSRRPWYVHVWLSKLLLMMMPTLYGKRSGICTPFTSAHVKRPIQGQSCHVTLTFFQNCRIGNFGEFNEPLLDFLVSKKEEKSRQLRCFSYELMTGLDTGVYSDGPFRSSVVTISGQGQSTITREQTGPTENGAMHFTEPCTWSSILNSAHQLFMLFKCLASKSGRPPSK